MIPSTMKAAVLTRFGSPDNITIKANLVILLIKRGEDAKLREELLGSMDKKELGWFAYALDAWIPNGSGA